MTGAPALRVYWSRKAESDLAKLAQRDFDRVQAAVRRFAEYRRGDVQRVRRGESVRYRLKAGSFRVIFGREEDGIRVHRVHHRREAYRKSAWIDQDARTVDGPPEADSPDAPGASNGQEGMHEGSGVSDLGGKMASREPRIVQTGPRTCRRLTFGRRSQGGGFTTRSASPR